MRKEKLWLAILLNLLFLPFGYYYLKSEKRFFLLLLPALFLGPLFNFFGWVLLGLLQGYPHIIALIVFIPIWHGLLAFDTIREYHKNNPSPRSIYHQPRALIFLGLLIPAMVAFSLWLPDAVEHPFLRGHAAVSANMMPTLQPGDYFYADQLFSQKKLKRGIIITFRKPDSQTQHSGLRISRIIGVTGDTVRMAGDLVSINGVSWRQVTASAEETREMLSDADWFPPENPDKYELVREYRSEKEFHLITLMNKRAEISPRTLQTWMVPAGKVFVLGDNRYDSEDSRSFGFVDVADIAGIYGYTYLAIDRKLRFCAAEDAECLTSQYNLPAYTIRWKRMGRAAF